MTGSQVIRSFQILSHFLSPLKSRILIFPHGVGAGSAERAWRAAAARVGQGNIMHFAPARVWNLRGLVSVFLRGFYLFFLGAPLKFLFQ